MAKRGSASARIGMNTSAFAAGARTVLKIQRTLADGFKSLARTAFGTAGGIGIDRFARRLVASVEDVSDMAREFDNIKAASGVIASDLQKMRFSARQRVSFSTAERLLGDSGRVWDKYAGAIRDASVRWAATSEKAQAAWAAIIGELSPAFSQLLEDLNKFNFIGVAVEFGKKLADGVKIVYQLLSDGTLLSTIGEHFKTIIASGTEGLIALAKTGAQIVELMWKNGFVKALDFMWGKWMSFTERMSKQFGDVMYDMVTDVMEKWNGLLDKGNAIAFGYFKMGNTDAIYNAKKRRDAEIDARRDAVRQRSGDGTEYMNFADELKKIVNDFQAHGFDTPSFDKFKSDMDAALNKFNARTTENPKFDIENRSVGQRFAATSLAAIGGGGNVGPTAVQTMADSTRRTATATESMNVKMGQMLQHFLQQGINNPRSMEPSNMVQGIPISNFA